VRRSDQEYEVFCSTPNQLAHVGWSLFHTHLSNLCQVTSTSGDAEERASAYQSRRKRRAPV